MLSLAWEQSMRMMSDSCDISHEKMPTGFRSGFGPMPSATFSQMFIAREVLPMEGRAASTIISP